MTSIDNYSFSTGLIAYIISNACYGMISLEQVFKFINAFKGHIYIGLKIKKLFCLSIARLFLILACSLGKYLFRDFKFVVFY